MILALKLEDYDSFISPSLEKTILYFLVLVIFYEEWMVRIVVDHNQKVQDMSVSVKFNDWYSYPKFYITISFKHPIKTARIAFVHNPN